MTGEESEIEMTGEKSEMTGESELEMNSRGI